MGADAGGGLEVVERLEELMPSRKWFAARVVALTTLATTWATTGSWDREETLFTIGIASAALLSWLVPNKDEEA